MLDRPALEHLKGVQEAQYDFAGWLVSQKRKGYERPQFAWDVLAVAEELEVGIGKPA